MKINIKLLVTLFTVSIIGVTLYYIFTTSPSIRYWVDDFCSSALLYKEGFWGTQISLWNTWTGRYSATFFTSLIETIGPTAIKFLPLVLLWLLIISAKKMLFGSIVFASLFIVLALTNSPNIVQSLYWQTGSLNYLIPFVFLNIFMGILISKKEKLFIPLAFLLMFIAGGFSEAFALAALTLIFFVIVGILIINPKDKKKYLKISIAGFIGVLISIIIMFLAPGNSLRGLNVTKPESIIFVVNSTIETTKWYLLRFFGIKTFMCSLGLIATYIFIFYKKESLDIRKNLILMAISITTSIFIATAVIGSGFYSMSIIPPDRTLFIVTTMILMCFVVFAFCLVGLIRRFLNKKTEKYLTWGMIGINLFLSIILIASINFRFGRAKTEIVNYAKSWDQEVQNLPVIKNVTSVGGLDNFTDNKGWVASCLAGYYSLNNVVIQTYDDKIIK